MIRPLIFPDEMEACVQVIRKSFATVARIYHLTPQNAPANGAFITINRIEELHVEGSYFIGYFEGDLLVGTAVVHQAVGGVFRIEKLAVLPQFRHHGIGAELLESAEEAVQEQDGRIVNIGVINENILVKHWFHKHGFAELEIKQFPGHPFSVCFMEKSLRANANHKSWEEMLADQKKS